MTRPTCAICADEIQPKEHVIREPLGKGGAMVVVCEGCRSERPLEVTSDRQWEPTGGLLNVDDASAGARRAMGNAEYERLQRVEDDLARKPAPGTTATDRDWIAYQHDNIRRHRSRASERRSHKSSREKKLY